MIVPVPVAVADPVVARSEQTPRRASQPVEPRLSSLESHAKTTSSLSAQILAKPDCSVQPISNTDQVPAVQTTGVVPVDANSVASANRDTI